jgi:hypothetical protein
MGPERDAGAHSKGLSNASFPSALGARSTLRARTCARATYVGELPGAHIPVECGLAVYERLMEAVGHTESLTRVSRDRVAAA